MARDDPETEAQPTNDTQSSNAELSNASGRKTTDSYEHVVIMSPTVSRFKTVKRLINRKFLQA